MTAGDALEWIGRLGEVPPGQGLLLAVAAFVGLWAPDVDLWVIRLLHHRSILTHSVLLPFLVMWALPQLGPAAMSGASTRELMGRMGHVSVDAALVYQHATAARDRAIADALDALGSPGLRVHWDVLPGEHHITVWPAAFSRGLLALHAPSYRLGG